MFLNHSPIFSQDNGLNAAARDGGTAGIATRAKGFLAYHEICRHIKSGWTVVQVLNIETLSKDFGFKFVFLG